MSDDTAMDMIDQIGGWRSATPGVRKGKTLLERVYWIQTDLANSVDPGGTRYLDLRGGEFANLPRC